MLETIRTPFMFQKGGIFYFSRRVPEDLREHYSVPRIVFSLRTRSRRTAAARAMTLAASLEEDWLTLRRKASDGPLRRYLKASGGTTSGSASSASKAPFLSEAKDHYVRTKGAGRSATFAQASDRAVRYLTDLHGDRPIDAYTRKEVNGLRDRLFERGLSQASVKRTLSALRAIVNFTTREQGLDEVRAFSGLYLGEEQPEAEQKRNPIPLGAIRKVQAECRQLDDEARWLVALASDTGMRLSEAVGLLKEDVVLSGDHPHVVLKGHPWRRLKTKGSERIVPLVGASLWAAERATALSGTRFLFPKYCDETQCKANSASAALNKWLSPRVPGGCVMHSFRHSLRDRLRAVECPMDITDRLGGWKVGGVGEGYGDGYPVDVLWRWMKRIE